MMMFDMLGGNRLFSAFLAVPNRRTPRLALAPTALRIFAGRLAFLMLPMFEGRAFVAAF